MIKALELMVEVLVTAGRPAYGEDGKLTEVALEWLEAGFSPDDAGNWLEVSCWSASVARKFLDAGLDPEDVSFVTTTPRKSTLADKASTGDLSVEAAIRIANSRK